MMDDRGKSHNPIVPEKSPNKAPSGAAVGMEGRGCSLSHYSDQSASRSFDQFMIIWPEGYSPPGQMGFFRRSLSMRASRA
jgi:hypothetical protein